VTAYHLDECLDAATWQDQTLRNAYKQVPEACRPNAYRLLNSAVSKGKAMDAACMHGTLAVGWHSIMQLMGARVRIR
jgi:hypothetical protein